MLYRLDKKILLACVKAQKEGPCYVYIDKESQCCYHVDSLAQTELQQKVRFHVKKHLFDESMDNLLKDGFLTTTVFANIYHVTYDGWNARSVRVADISKLIITHVAFPSLVAFITTLLTIWLTSIL